MTQVTPRLTCMRGYPGSGKSTIARTLPGVVVSRDDLRMALYGQYRLRKDGEDAVTVAEQAMVRALLADGRDVIVDAMHVNPRYLRQWAKVASNAGALFTVHNVRTPLMDCVDRDGSSDRMEQGKSVGEKVITEIADRFPMDKWPNVEPVKPLQIEPAYKRLHLPPAIIVDIDGTLAHMNDRSPYDYTKVIEDDVDETILGIVDAWSILFETGKVLIVSGRDHTCREDTEEWLEKHGISYDHLYMRHADLRDERGNKLPDYIVKYNIFNDHIRDKYNIDFVLDDRNQVVEMWRKLGLKCLQVAPGDF